MNGMDNSLEYGSTGTRKESTMITLSPPPETLLSRVSGEILRHPPESKEEWKTVFLAMVRELPPETVNLHLQIERVLYQVPLSAGEVEAIAFLAGEVPSCEMLSGMDLALLRQKESGKNSGELGKPSGEIY